MARRRAFMRAARGCPNLWEPVSKASCRVSDFVQSVAARDRKRHGLSIEINRVACNAPFCIVDRRSAWCLHRGARPSDNGSFLWRPAAWEARSRATFRQHVVQAARGDCDEYGAEMTPHAARADPLYCLDMFRSWIIGEMSPEARRAYFQARREAAVRGRQLCRRELACESASGEETGVGRGTAPQLMRCRIAQVWSAL